MNKRPKIEKRGVPARKKTGIIVFFMENSNQVLKKFLSWISDFKSGFNPDFGFQIRINPDFGFQIRINPDFGFQIRIKTGFRISDPD
jgi:hypothetical protein